MADEPVSDRTLEAQERLERQESTKRAIQRNISQARGELERGDPEHVLKVTSLMLRGRNLRSLSPPQVPLVYYRGQAFERLGDTEGAIACYRVLASWNGGANAIVDDAMVFIDLGVERLLELVGSPPEAGHVGAEVPPERDPRVFPRPILGAGLLVGAVAATGFLTLLAVILLLIFKI